MAVKAIADNATGELLSFINGRSPDPPYDADTQTLVHLPEPPDVDTQRWDRAKGVTYRVNEDGDVIDSSVPLRGLNAAEQAEVAAAQAALKASSQVDAMASQRQLMFKVLESLELLDRRLAFIENRLSISFTSGTAAEVKALRDLGAAIKQIVGE